MERSTTLVTETARDRWRRQVDARPEAPCLRAEGRTWTYAEADQEVRRLAAGFEALGVGLGTKVAVGADTSSAGFFVHLALRELGAVMVALVPTLTEEELAYQIDHSGSEVLWMEGAVAETLDRRASRFESVRYVISPTGEHAGKEALRTEDLAADQPLEIRPLEGYDHLTPSVILYTSGSTAKPKGVVLPDGALVTSGQGYVDSFQITGDDNFILPFTLAHGVGGLVVPGIGLASGCQITLEPKFSPSVWWHRCRDSGATITLLFPAQLQLLLKLAREGAEVPDNDLRFVITHVYDQAFAERFKVGIGLVWSCTEAGANGVASGLGYHGERGEGYVGPPMGVEELRICASDGTDLPPGETGEIWMRHPHTMIEYFRQPEETAKTLVEGGWVRTGDYGALGEDGHLFYRGRMKNMVKRSGENISPEEVEATMLEHPAIVECVVFGVPDPLRTEELAAHVVVSDAFDGDPEGLSTFVSDRLARWKAPRYVRVYKETFPRLASGKIDRVSVREDFDPALCWDREAGRQ